MMDFGCHRLEILLNLFGPIERTTSAIGRALFGREVEDTCVASLEFESGAQASSPSRTPRSNRGIRWTFIAARVRFIRHFSIAARFGL